MFGLFNQDPVKKLEKEYNKKLLAARNLQRNGDIVGYAKIMAEAEELGKKMDELATKTS